MSSLWTDDLVTGIEEIDKQHYEIIDKMSEMEVFINENKTTEFVFDYLDFLYHYIHAHFKSEEKWMKENNYGSLETHQIQHRGFIRKVEDMIEKFDVVGESDNFFVEIHMFVSSWFITHIRKVDLEMIKEIKNR
ncbi:MAG: hemerythrin family protein [Candidatus Heimdallarchaeota archaeon]|nr:hemerythrin family protein [Candidatus Heimdallarchaeota archaeon]